MKKNRGRIDLKRNDLELQRTEEERRDDLVDWTIWSSNLHKEECWVRRMGGRTRVLRTRVPRGFFSTSDATTYKSRLRNLSFIWELEF